PTAVRIAGRRAGQRGVTLAATASDAERIGVKSDAFDLVVSCECLEHVPFPDRMARELYRILAPGGRCLLTTPSYLNGMAIGWIHAGLTGRKYDSGAGVQPHESFFLFFRVARMLRRAGFRLLRTDSRVFQFLLLPRVSPARFQVLEFERGIW